MVSRSPAASRRAANIRTRTDMIRTLEVTRRFSCTQGSICACLTAATPPYVHRRRMHRASEAYLVHRISAPEYVVFWSTWKAMNADRRAEIAAVGAALLDCLQEEVMASWVGLWPVERAQRLRTLGGTAASRAALEALLTVFEQGDLDERTLEHTRATVLAGTSTVDEADELLRTIWVVGVGRLTELLVDRIGLTHEERFQLQHEASVLGPELLGSREEPEPRVIDALLAELERSGPDLR
jgi:hypothetical protein